MRLLFVADGRSPIALNWIRSTIEQGNEVHLASTFPCDPLLKLASLSIVPVAFSSMKTGQAAQTSSGLQLGRRASIEKILPVRARTAVRQWLGPLTLGAAARRLRLIITSLQPDLVHAMRIPYEGMIAAGALGASGAPPLLISTWGNDFTLHAPSTPLMARLTRRALGHAAGLHADCQRDARLACVWGYPAGRPVLVAPGNGGIDLQVFTPPAAGERQPLVINPRGFRAYVRSEAFFRAIPLVLARRGDARFVCLSMAGEARAAHWLDELGLHRSVELLPTLPRERVAELFQTAQVAVSPSAHDGTPNTLLEAMACGCFPVAGDIESLREWITPGVNGLLVDPDSPEALAQGMLLALEQPALRQCGAGLNLDIIRRRAEVDTVMQQAMRFYASLN